MSFNIDEQSDGPRGDVILALVEASRAFPTLTLGTIVSNAIHPSESSYKFSDDELALRLRRYIDWQKEKDREYKEWLKKTRNGTPEPNVDFVVR